MTTLNTVSRKYVSLQHFVTKSRDADASTMRAGTIQRIKSEFDYRHHRQECNQRTVIRSLASYDTVKPLAARPRIKRRLLEASLGS
jgi:hypothetical protein